MLKQIKEVQDAWRATQRTLDIKVVVNGKTYKATDINSLKYDSGAYTGDTFSIGSTYSNNVQIEFSHLVEGLRLGMEIRPSIGIKTFKGYIYEPLGVFIISSEIKMDRNNNLTSISASDRFCGLEGTYKSKLVYPAKVLDIIAEICAQSGVKANADDLARLPHQADLPIPISGQSYRKALGWIAQLYAGYATFDRQGLFTIRTIAEPNYELDPSQYEQAGLTKNEAPYKIGGIQCQTVITTKTRDGENTEETKTYQVGDTSGSQIKLENNIMTPDRLNNIWEQIKDISFYPFNLNWFGNPAIEAGDWLRLEDKQGNKFIVPNNSYTLDFNGGLSATSKADQTSSTDSAISWRGTYAQIIEELQARKAPDGTVIFPPSVVEPPKNAKPNDVWFKQNGNSTELWVFTEQEDGTGKWIRRDLTPDEIKKQVQEAQSGLSDAKKQIADNLAKANGDIAELNKSINNQKGSIDGLNTTVNTVVIPKVTDITNQVSDAITKVNEQKNIVTGLQNQAIQQGKDISKITTDVHGVTVDLANLNGDVNQTKATVQGLQSTLGNTQGDIAQIKVDAKKLETSLSGKVDNSTYANFVSATNNALNAKLVASDLNGYAKTTDVQATANGLQVNINSVSDRIDSLKIGSRNLLVGTARFENYRTNNGATLFEINTQEYIPNIPNHKEITRAVHTWQDWHSTYSNQKILLEKDKPYWFGFFVCTDNTDRSPFGGLNIYSNKDENVVNAKWWQYIDTKNYGFFGGSAKKWTWHAYKIIGDGEIYDNFRVETAESKGGSAYFAGYTLVQSDIAPTGYVDAFEDMEHSFSELSARINANSQQFNSYYTKTEVNNLKIGSQNLLSNVANFEGYQTNNNAQIFKIADQDYIPAIDNHPELTNASHAWNNWQSAYSTQDVVLEKNKTYWIGFYTCTDRAESSPFGTIYFFGAKKGEPLSNSKVFIVQDTKDFSYFGNAPKKWTWHAYKFIGDGETYSGLRIEGNESYGGSIYFAGYTLIQSDIAPTGYISSADDLKFSISQIQSQINQTAGTISSVVGRVNTLESRDSTHIIDHPIDANDYIESGIYFIKSLESINVPYACWFYLEIVKASDGRIVQTWQRDDIPTERFIRTYNGSWSGWERNASFSEYSRLNQTVLGLQSTVSNNFANLQSQINQTAGTIRSEVTNSVNGLQSQINQTANSLNFMVGDLSNLCRNSTFENGNGTGWDSLSFSVEHGWADIPTENCGVLFTRDAFYGDQFSVSPGQKFYTSIFVQSGSGYPFRLGLQIKMKDGNWNWIVGSYVNPGAIGTFEGKIIIPDGAVKARIWISIDGWPDKGENLGWVRFTNVVVKRDTTISQLNISAGTTLIQNDKIYMDASSTVFSGKAFIPDAAITNISADKINTGTLDAGRINVINLNASNITTGTINGANLKINLNDGNVEFQQGRIHNWNNTIDININQNYISTANYDTRAILKDGELQLVQPELFDKSSDPYLRIHNWLTGSSWATGVIEARNGITINQKKYEATSIFDNKGYTNTWAGFYTGTSDYTHELLTAIGGANKGVIIHGGTYYKGALNSQNVPRILVGSSMYGDHLGDNRIRIEADYVHIPSVNAKTTGSAPNVYVSPDGALVRSTSASKYKTDIQRSYSTDYGDKLLDLPTAIWTDKGQKERYEAGKRHIKPEQYFGMIAEDLANAGLDLLVSRNPETHEIEGIQYERIAPALLPVIKKLKDKVNRLEKQINER